MGVFLFEAVHRGIAPVGLQRGAPAELAFVAVALSGELRQHRGHVAVHEAVPDVEDGKRGIGRGQGIGIERLHLRVIEAGKGGNGRRAGELTPEECPGRRRSEGDAEGENAFFLHRLTPARMTPAVTRRRPSILCPARKTLRGWRNRATKPSVVRRRSTASNPISAPVMGNWAL